MLEGKTSQDKTGDKWVKCALFDEFIYICFISHTICMGVSSVICNIIVLHFEAHLQLYPMNILWKTIISSLVSQLMNVSLNDYTYSSACPISTLHTHVCCLLLLVGLLINVFAFI